MSLAQRFLLRWVHMWDVAGICPNDHGGHQFDARYCRICGQPLHHRKELTDART